MNDLNNIANDDDNNDPFSDQTPDSNNDASENDNSSESKATDKVNEDNNKNNTVNQDNTDEDVEVIYKKERNPIVKFLLGFLGFLVIAYIVLFATGFIMGWMGIHPPTLDNDVISNQWEKVTGGETTEEPPSELEKKEPEKEADEK